VRARGQAIAEFAVASVVLLGTIVAVIDLALWLHSQNVVLAASQEAAAVGSRGDGTSSVAEQAAWNVLRAGLGSSVTGVDSVTVTIDPETTTAEVSGTWYVAPLGALVPVPLHARTTMLRQVFRPGGR
jgi:Flp pilus assembly protein TadG